VSEKPSPYADIIGVLTLLPALVREKRRREGLSVRAAAKQVGIPYQNLSRYERGGDAVLGTTVLPLLKWVAQ